MCTIINIVVHEHKCIGSDARRGSEGCQSPSVGSDTHFLQQKVIFYRVFQTSIVAIEVVNRVASCFPRRDRDYHQFEPGSKILRKFSISSFEYD